MEPLSQTLYLNAVKLLSMERRSSRRVDQVYRMMAKHNIQAGIADWLANPFVQTALKLLRGLTGNYRVREAVKLLEEAGQEAEQENRKKKR